MGIPKGTKKDVGNMKTKNEPTLYSGYHIDVIIYSEGNLRGHMETAKFYECVDHS